MAKYLIQSSGNLKEEAAVATSAGAGDAGKIPELDGAGRLANSMMPVGIGADTAVIVASEDLSAGEYVNIWDDAGTPKARLADATTAGKPADGFVLAAALATENATVYFEGSNNQQSGLTAGQLFLSTTAGAATATPPSTAGNVVQKLGKAYSATSSAFEASNPIELV